MRQPSASAKSRILLLLTSILLCFGLVESGLRVRTYLFNRSAFEVVFSADSLPFDLVGEELDLAGIIRPVADPKIIYELRPGLSGVFEGGRVTINADGFRGQSYPVAKPAGVSRIVGIGDSFMFGLGVSDGETYLERLEVLLNRDPELLDWQLINTSVPGYNTVMEVATLRTRGLEYSPDYVLIEFVTNDIALPNFIRTRVSPFAARSFIVDWYEERRSRSRRHPLIQVLNRGGLSVAPTDDTGMRFESDPRAVPPEYRSMVGWDAYVAAMEELRELQRARGFEVILLSLTNGSRGITQRALELGAKLGFSVVDIEPALESYMNEHGIESYLGSVLSLSASNGHPSAVAHGIIADQLYDHLIPERPQSPVPGSPRTESR